MNYNFVDEKNTMVITTKNIVNKKKSILLVSHDEDDGMWEFLDGDDVKEEDAMIVSLARFNCKSDSRFAIGMDFISR